MLFKRISRTQPEVVYVVAKNVSGGTLTAGYSCVWDTGASADGVRVTQVTTNTAPAYAGVADADIANNAYGLIQVYGFRSSALITYSSVSIVAGDALGPYSGNWGLARQAAGTVLVSQTGQTFAFACEAVASSSAVAITTTAKVFIRAL